MILNFFCSFTFNRFLVKCNLIMKIVNLINDNNYLLVKIKNDDGAAFSIF